MATARQQLPIRQGSVYWLENCAPLDGKQEKRRPVVVIIPPESESDVICVVGACTASATDADPSRVPLPNRQETPQAKSGLTKPCWLIPRWYLSIERSRLTDYCGHLTGGKLREVVAAVLAEMAKAGPPLRQPPGE